MDAMMVFIESSPGVPVMFRVFARGGAAFGTLIIKLCILAERLVCLCVPSIH